MPVKIKKFIAIFIAIPILAFFVWAIRWTPVGPGIRIPKVFAQYTQQLCPTTLLPMEVAAWTTYNTTGAGGFIQWGCVDPLGNLVFAGRVYAAQPGFFSTSDKQITACLNTVVLANLTICDVRGWGSAPGPITSTIAIPANVTLLFDVNSKFQSSTSSLNLFTVGTNARVDGFLFDCGNQPSYNGTVFTFNSNYADGNTTLLLNHHTTCGSVTTGIDVLLTATGPSQNVSFVRLEHIRIFGLHDGIKLTATNNGFVNGNHFIDFLADNTVTGIHFANNGGQLNGNICVPCSYEATISGHGVNGILYDGTTGATDTASQNLYIGDIWDVPTNSVSYLNTKATGNWVQGLLNGSVNDPSSANFALNNAGLFVGGTLTMNTTILANGGIIPVNIQPNSGQILISKVAPTISSGFGTSAAIGTNPNGPSSFTVNVGTGGVATGGTIALPGVANGWTCSVSNITAHLGNRADDTVQTASTTSSVSVQNQTKSTGAAIAWTASDTIQLNCFGR